METKLVNLTGHPVTLIGPWNVTTIPAIRGRRARVNSQMRMVDRVAVPSSMDGLDDWFIPVLEIVEQSVIGVPEPEDGVVYIVSGIVAGHPSLRDRKDIVTVSRVDRTLKTIEGARALLRVSNG